VIERTEQATLQLDRVYRRRAAGKMQIGGCLYRENSSLSTSVELRRNATIVVTAELGLGQHQIARSRLAADKHSLLTR